MRTKKREVERMMSGFHMSLSIKNNLRAPVGADEKTKIQALKNKRALKSKVEALF